MTEPTKLDPEYYPRIKHNRRWYLIVPELHTSYNGHDGCAFYRPDKDTEDREPEACCRLVPKGKDFEDVPLFERHDCGHYNTMFVAPSKFPEYRAHLVAEQLEGKP